MELDDETREQLGYGKDSEHADGHGYRMLFKTWSKKPKKPKATPAPTPPQFDGRSRRNWRHKRKEAA